MGNPFVCLHIAIIIAGFTAVLGKLILLSEGPLVWWRMLLTTLLFCVYLKAKNKLPRLSWRDIAAICASGALIAVHWIFFYGSIKYANVSIAVVCFAMVGFFTAIFEPLSNKKPLSLRELLFSVITVAGIALIFHFDAQFRTGIILGILSAAFAALFTISMKRLSTRHASSTILLFQMGGGFAFLSLAAPLYLAFFPGIKLMPDVKDFLYLLVLSSICTIGLFSLQIQALRHISAFTVNLSFNLEPVYSILLAMLFLGEANELGASFFAGLTLICLSVALQSLYTMRHTKALRAMEQRKTSQTP